MYGTQGRILVTGATGTVGRDVIRALAGSGERVVAASRHLTAAPELVAPAAEPPARTGEDPGTDAPGRATRLGEGTDDRVDRVRFDYADQSSWAAALEAVDRVFLVRPPAVSNVRRDMVPFLEAARSAGARHVVLLSVQGADRVPVVPHARLEHWLRDSGLAWTFVRPSFFVQNLTGVHAPDVVARRLVLPAGRGRTAFVDARDVAALAATVLRDPAPHAGRVWTPTGPQALTYDEVAAALSDVLGDVLGEVRGGAAREVPVGGLGPVIRYVPVGLLRYALHARRDLGMGWPMVGVTAAIYTTARLGLAAGITGDVRTVTGRPPASLRDVAVRERVAWTPPAPATSALGPSGLVASVATGSVRNGGHVARWTSR